MLLECQNAESIMNPPQNVILECQNAELFIDLQRKQYFGVPERRVHYRSPVKTRFWGARPESLL